MEGGSTGSWKSGSDRSLMTAMCQSGSWESGHGPKLDNPATDTPESAQTCIPWHGS